MSETIYSLTRFLKEKPKLPCWIAGRVFKQQGQTYLLQSQGLKLFCKNTSPKANPSLNSTPNYKEGSWVAVECLSSISVKKQALLPNNQASKKPSCKEAESPSKLESWNRKEEDHTLEPNTKLRERNQTPFLENKNFNTPDKEAIYQTGKSFLLQKPISSYRERDFSYNKKGNLLQSWRLFLKQVEDFLLKKGLASVETPYLVKCPGTEPHLKAIKSSFKNYYLPTSPEMQLKKLLCQDWTDFFEIKTCFRDEESSDTHQAEFHLLEWYRAFYSLEELMKELYELIVVLQDSFKNKTHTSTTHKSPPANFVTVSQLFKQHFNFSLQPKTSKEELFNLARKNNLPVKKNFSFEDLFFILFLNQIEQKLCPNTATFIYNYPPQLRAFAKINKEGWASRFELYWKGLELANAFYEVSHSAEQKKLFENHIKSRKGKQNAVPLDKELLSMMREGMPPCSGLALGLDRLFLALTGQKNLQALRLFPLS